MRTVVICGAGIAGSTLAYWLARRGFQPIVVEQSQGLRSSGNPVDIRGPARPVAEAMGVVPRLREAATLATTMCAVDESGRTVARMRIGRADDIEIPRADLAAILYEAARDDAEFRFDDTITALRADGDGVEVTFARSAARRADLVVGADGLHSAVRRLAFGPERDFVRHLGLFVATLPLGAPAEAPSDVLLFNAPGRLASIHPSRGEAIAAFIFRGPARPGLDNRDIEQHKQIVLEAYAGLGWRVPELLDRVRAADDLYFDAVSTVCLPSWSHGGVTLAGDAASCVSLFGDGSTLAMAGAHTLAEALAAEPDQTRALERYEVRHRRLVEPKQRHIGRAAGMLVPKTRLGIAVRNLAAQALP